MELNPNTYNPQIHETPQQWRRQTPPQLTMRTFAPLGPTGQSLVSLHSLPLGPQTSSYTLQDNETYGFNVLPPVEESPRSDPTLPPLETVPIMFYDSLSDGSDHTRASPSLSPMQPMYSGRVSPSLSPLPSLPTGPFPMLGPNASDYSGRISPSYAPLPPMPVMIDTPAGPTFLYPIPSPYQPSPGMGPMFSIYQTNPPPTDPNHSPTGPQLLREPEAYDSENLFLDDKQDMVYCRFLDVSLRLLEDIERQAHREGCKWSRQTRVAVKNLKSDLKSNYLYWAHQNDFELLDCYIEIAHEMAILIEHDTKGKKRIGELVKKFQNMLEYMKRDNFDIYEAGLDIEGFEQRRAVLLHVRLFKSLQLMRFKEFSVTLSTELNNCAERNLRGKQVIRNRCKRMDSFRPEAHRADMFIRDYILTGKSGIVDMYICKDHKPQTIKNKNKPRVVGGLLYYYVCESEDAAERFLRELVKYCEFGHQAKVAIKQKMFRKHGSTKGDLEEDRRVRNMLCSKQHWSREDFEMQKTMYHFTLAIPEESKRQDISKPSSTHPSYLFVTGAYPQTRSRRHSFEVSPRAVAH